MNEYIGAKRRAYEASRPDRHRLILDDVCEMTGYSRKDRVGTDPWTGQGQTLGQDKTGRQQGQTLVTTGTLV